MRRGARLLFWVGLLAIAIATLGPIEARPETGLHPQVERLGAFLVLSFLLTMGYPRRRAFGWVALIGVAAVLEISQNHVPGRHGRVIDFDVKAMGVVLGVLVGIAFDRIGQSVRST